VRQAQEYAYDANGSLTQDRNKGLTGIAYNHLSLPEKVSFSATDYLEFRYSATGQKVAKLVYQTGKPVQRTDYLGPYQYEQDSLRFFPHAEGRVLRTVNATSGADTYRREYTLKDHLGNLRLAYRLGPGPDLHGHARTWPRRPAPARGPAVRLAQRLAPIAHGHPPGPLRWPTPPSSTPAGPRPSRWARSSSWPCSRATRRQYRPGLYPQCHRAQLLVLAGSFLTGLLQPAPNLPAPPDAVRRGGLPLLQVGVAAGLAAGAAAQRRGAQGVRAPARLRR
jgi:hypothetical protein